MDEVNYDILYNQLIGLIDAITTKENVSKKDLRNLIIKLEQYIDLDISLLTGKENDDLPF